MKRYQLYLRPTSLDVMEDFRKLTPLSKANIVREGIERIATGLVDYISQIVTTRKTPKYFYLNKLRGIIKDKKKINYSDPIDEVVYSQENL